MEMDHREETDLAAIRDAALRALAEGGAEVAELPDGGLRVVVKGNPQAL